MPPERRPPLERFLLKFDEEPNTGCWIWKGGKTVDGYASFARGGRNGMTLGHRFAYKTFREPIPVGLEIDHLCRNRACVNPWHMELVTRLENILRSLAATTRKTHCKNGHEFTPENTYIGRTRRSCRRCTLEAQQRYQRRKRCLDATTVVKF